MSESMENTSYEYSPEEIGEAILKWDVDEYPVYQRSRLWYILVGVIGFVFIVYAVATTNFLFAIIVLMSAVIMMISTFVKPGKVPVVITNTGVVVGDMYYDFQSIRDFSIVYEPPEVKWLYLDFHSMSHPLLSISLEDMDPNAVRAELLPYCMENLNRNEERLTDLVRRLYKL